MSQDADVKLKIESSDVDQASKKLLLAQRRSEALEIAAGKLGITTAKMNRKFREAEAAGKRHEAALKRQTAELKRMERTAAKARRDGIDNFKRGILSATTALASFGTAYLAGMSAFAKAADQLDKNAKLTQLSTTAFSELEYVMNQNGITTTKYIDAMRDLNKITGQAKSGLGVGVQTFKDLGLYQDILAGKFQNTEQLFTAVWTELAKIEDGQKRAAMTGKLFGEQSGNELATKLPLATSAIKDMREEASRLSLVMGDDVVARGVELTDMLDQVKKTLTVSFATAMSDSGGDIEDLGENLVWLGNTTIKVFKAMSESVTFWRTLLSGNSFDTELTKEIKTYTDEIDKLTIQFNATQNAMDVNPSQKLNNQLQVISGKIKGQELLIQHAINMAEKMKEVSLSVDAMPNNGGGSGGAGAGGSSAGTEAMLAKIEQMRIANIKNEIERARAASVEKVNLMQKEMDDKKITKTEFDDWYLQESIRLDNEIHKLEKSAAEKNKAIRKQNIADRLALEQRMFDAVHAGKLAETKLIKDEAVKIKAVYDIEMEMLENQLKNKEILEIEYRQRKRELDINQLKDYENLANQIGAKRKDDQEKVTESTLRGIESMTQSFATYASISGKNSKELRKQVVSDLKAQVYQALVLRMIVGMSGGAIELNSSGSGLQLTGVDAGSGGGTPSSIPAALSTMPPQAATRNYNNTGTTNNNQVINVTTQSDQPSAVGEEVYRALIASETRNTIVAEQQTGGLLGR